MKLWSIAKPPDNWRVQIYFDTNILLSLSDNNFPSLSFSITYLATKDLCLTSRMSRQDCMITSSASFPKNNTRESDVVIWTADEDFYKSFHECNEIKTIFPDNVPTVEWINSFKLQERNGKTKELNL